MKLSGRPNTFSSSRKSSPIFLDFALESCVGSLAASKNVKDFKARRHKATAQSSTATSVAEYLLACSFSRSSIRIDTRRSA